MISVENRRYNGVWNEPTTVLREPDRALLGLMKFELGFGGRVTGIDEEDNGDVSITVETPLPAGLDRVRFSGPPQDMALLVRAVAAWGAVVRDGKLQRIMQERVLRALDRGSGTYLPIEVAHLAPSLMGEGTVKAALILMIFGLLSELDEDLIQTALKTDIDDLCAVVGMAHDEGMEPSEAFQILTGAGREATDG